jgi:hypothetical protein
MLRYIYCPDESMLPEATALSTEFVVPIMLLPDHELIVDSSFMAYYSNDIIPSSDIDLFVFYKDKETKITTMIQDKRTLRFAILPKSEGLYKIIVKHKDKEIETHEFMVEKG